MDDKEQVFLICGYENAMMLIEQNPDLKNNIIVPFWIEDMETVVVIKAEDWHTCIDNAITFARQINEEDHEQV